jgi:hypothetical protein
MKVFIANFGRANQLWPACLKRSTVATFEDEDLRPFWLAGDREGYIAKCIASKKTAAGITPTKSVASRWFNLATIISSTENDVWIHREKDELWWTTSLPGDAQVSLEAALPPSHLSERVYVIHKPARPWSDKSTTGSRLRWGALHPKAREFLFTEGTLQKLSDDHAAYAMALIEGSDLTAWHGLPHWKGKAERARKGAVTIFSAKQSAVTRMAMMTMATVKGSNGQQVLRTVKNKELRFGSQMELERYIAALIDSQEGLCALTGLCLQYDGEHDDPELLCSLDRIDSAGHYEAGNLQVVCRFVNRWKSDGDDGTFRRLLDLVRSQGSA